MVNNSNNKSPSPPPKISPRMRSMNIRDCNNIKFPPPSIALRAMSLDNRVKLRRHDHALKLEPPKRSDIVHDSETKTSVFTTWSINDDNVPTLPYMYLLRRTHTIISGVKASLIAANISKSLQKRSITAQFDNLKMIAHAQTSSHKKFNIRLFSKPNNGDSPTASKNIIVELNCVSPREFGFHQVVKAILEEARGNKDVISDQEMPRKRYKVNRELFPLISAKCQIEHAHLALEQANILLGNDACDSNSLGMKSLLILTDKQVCDNMVTTLAAKSVLAKDKCDSISLETTLYDFFVRGRDRKTGSVRRNNDNFFKEHCDKIRCDLLLILIHSIEILSRSSSSLSFDERCSDIWLSEDFINALLQDILHSIDTPHGAHIAHFSMQCLHSLVQNSTQVRTKILSMNDLGTTLRKAYDVGMNHHDHLAKESKYFMSTLAAM